MAAIMSDLLTTKQVQTLLQVDRTTIYRMLRDGRLSGVKLGHQWRFPAQQIQNLLEGSPLSLQEETGQVASESLPIFCFQSIQDIFTDITDIGAVTTKPDGTPLTQMTSMCQFCQMLLNSESGHRACQTSRRELVAYQQKRRPFAVCHAGLQYMQTPIKTNDAVDAMLIVGPFYTQRPDTAEEAARIQKLAREHNLNAAALAEAARDIPVLDGRQKAKIGDWLHKMAAVFEHISCERIGFTNRLQQIANMSDLANEPIRPVAQ